MSLSELSLEEKYKNLPKVPGVYIFKNVRDKVIYVGKAKVLRNRVSSYFQKNLKIGTKTEALVSRIRDIEYIETATELEALILEAELIKKYRPKYNIALKDDKSHLYIVFRNEVFTIKGKRVSIPKVITARKTDLKKRDVYFGPYPHANTAKYIVRIIRKAFPYRDCSKSKFVRHQKLNKPCLYGHMGLCQAPCAGGISVDDYKKETNRIKKFLKGSSSTLVREFKSKMTQASKDLEYEKAAYYRDILRKFEYVRADFKTAEKYIENPNLIEDIAEEALIELEDIIPVLKKKPKRIECYDISNISGKEAVGSMVVAIDGQITKSEYRKFKIKTKDTPDDFGMMAEVLTRRLKREFAPKRNVKEWGKPDLIVLDGGKGQVSKVIDALGDFSNKVPIVGLAKRYETIVVKEGKDFSEIRVDHSNEGLKLLINLRDEAHRFAQKYHHHLRLKKIRV